MFWCIVELGIAESILVRELLTDTVEDVGEGVVDDLLLRPRILTVAAHIGLERVLVLFLVRSHILSELRYNDTCVAEVLSPALYPFKGNIPVVVDRDECSDHILYGNIACAHNAVFNSTVGTQHAVLGLNEFNAFAEVCDSGLGRLSCIAVGVVHIPESGDLSASHLVQQSCKTCRIAVNAVCFNEESDIVFLSDRNELCESLSDVIIVNIAAGCRFEVAEDSYIGSTEFLSELCISALSQLLLR